MAQGKTTAAQNVRYKYTRGVIQIYRKVITIIATNIHPRLFTLLPPPHKLPLSCFSLLPSKIVARPRTSPYNVVDDARRACSASIARKIRVATHSNSALAIYPNHMGGDPFMLDVSRLTIHSRLYKSMSSVIGYGP